MADLVCRETAAHYPLTAPIWRSPAGGLLDVVVDLPAGPLPTSAEAGLWRYRAVVPLADPAAAVTLGEGGTPMVAGEVAGRPVRFKLEYLSPTGSFKDRGAAVLISQVRGLGIERVVEDSSGNAGAALAAYAARAGVACDVYVPASAPPGKLAMIERFGATVHREPGPRAAAARAAWQTAESTYYASHAWNPFFFQGTKTIAYEIVEQLAGQAPDALVLPVGHGTLLIGAYLGFEELCHAGVIDRLPKLVAVQTAACAPLYEAWRAEQGAGPAAPVAPANGPPFADGIAIAEPVRAEQCSEAVRASGGTFVVVSDAEVADAWRLLLRQGFYIEPTAAVAVAGLAKCADLGDTVVVPLTGSGLKTSAELRE